MSNTKEAEPTYYFCTCCTEMTYNWYINGTTEARAKYCKICSISYTPTERKQKETKYVFDLIKNMKSVKEKLI